MNYLWVIILISACSKNFNYKIKDEEKIIKIATFHLIENEIINNKCISMNDTIYLIVKNGEKLHYYYNFEDKIVSQIWNNCDSAASQNQCLLINLNDFINNNKINFKYTCAGSLKGYIKMDKDYKIVDSWYVKRSH